ncbi:TPA: IS4 family transposase [Escherichia coli]|uniref:IS4 family transposase n=1 Tax=Shewanella xiamenensis TaxID=332186 RepID=UPI00255A943D|nr:IS4 family transposase [Shewanella xiamenensis]MDL3986360.1 IS4 family transposase [Shewanella xiamenensis]
MNVQRMLADFLSFVTPQNIHKTRMASLCASLQSLVTHGKCTVTAIGRGIQSSATEKSCIKRADRLLSNEAFQSDIPLIYAALTKALVQTKQPLILVDWSNADNKKRHFILRASLALEGRSLTLQQEVKAMDDYNCPRVHQAFLLRLKASLPADCRPIVVTDAGFKVPWLKQIRKLGWHYIARVRGNQTLQLPDCRAFISVGQLYKKARTTPQCLGKIKLTSSQRYITTAVLVGTGWKLRKRDKHKSYKEPWLLVSSLAQTADYASKIAKCYNARMQIEESFRDQKSQTYGLGSNAHQSYKNERLKVLLMLAALASWLHYMLGLAVEISGQHRSLQANSIKHRRVLSFNYLGMRLCRLARLAISAQDIQAAIRQIMRWADEWDWKNINSVSY